MQYRALHCWDCGLQIIDGVHGMYTLRSEFRQVKFGLADGSYCESPFCAACATREWTPVRAKAFEEAVNRVSPLHQITVVSVEGSHGLTLPVLAVLDPVTALRTNRTGG